MPLLLAILLFVLAPFTAVAACSGQDLRPGLSDDARAALEKTANAIPFGQGNHWLAQRGNRQIHVIGTMHIYDPRMDAVLNRLRPTIEAADALLLEATKTEERALQNALVERPELLFLEGGKRLDQMLPADKWQVVSGRTAALGIPTDMAATFQPWYLSLLMGVPGCALAEIATGVQGFDKMIADVADAAEIPTRALEPYDKLFDLFHYQPLQKQVDILSLSALQNDAAEDLLYTMKESYFEESPAQLWETSRHLTYQSPGISRAQVDAVFADYGNLLLEKRNAAWMPIIDGTPESKIVVAVGAAHLMGKNGILNLLQDRGYTLTRQPF